MSDTPIAKAHEPVAVAFDNLYEIGTSGVKHTGTVIIDEFIHELQGSQGAKTFREMVDNEAVLGAAVFAIERLTIQIDWRVEPFKDDDGNSTKTDEDTAKFVESCMYDMSDSWETTLSGILTFIPYGYAFCEIVYKKRGGRATNDPTKYSAFNDGKFGWRKIALRAQETTFGWELDEKGGVKGLQQQDPNAQPLVVIPIEKALLFRASSAKNNPEGKSLLRNAYRAWRFKKVIEEIEAIGMERDLAGMPIAYVPPELLSSNATPVQKATLEAVKKMVRGVKRNENEGIVFPMSYDANGKPLYDFKLLTAGGNRQFDTDKIITRYEKRMVMTLLADWLFLGHDATGSFALGSSKIDLFMASIGQIALGIAETFNQHAIPRLLELNGMDGARPPEITVGKLEHVDLGVLADFIQKAAASGAMVVDDSLDEYLRLIAGLPERDPNSKVGVPPMPNNSEAQPSKAGGAPQPKSAPKPAAQGNVAPAKSPKLMVKPAAKPVAPK